jgi:hypothetical protein
MDLDSIEPGLDFAEVIAEAVNSSAVLVVLIGRRWATLTDEDGVRRLDNPDDYVRFEVKTALECGVRVIPVLIDGARAPRPQDLPAELGKLARLSAHKLTRERYHDDTDRLIDLIRRVLATVGEQLLAEPERDGNGEDQVTTIRLTSRDPTGQPVRTALGIGAGTGKATYLFAQRGSRSPRPSRRGHCSPSCLSTR